MDAGKTVAGKEGIGVKTSVAPIVSEFGIQREKRMRTTRFFAVALLAMFFWRPWRKLPRPRHLPRPFRSRRKRNPRSSRIPSRPTRCRRTNWPGDHAEQDSAGAGDCGALWGLAVLGCCCNARGIRPGGVGWSRLHAPLAAGGGVLCRLLCDRDDCKPSFGRDRARCEPALRH